MIVGNGPDPLTAAYRLGRYFEVPPPPMWRVAVECFWVYASNRAAAVGPADHLVLPEPGVSLTFGCTRGDRGRSVDPFLAVHGSVSDPRVFRPSAQTELVSVRFFPEWAARLLAAHPPEHVNAIRDLAEVAPGLAGELGPALAETRSWREALACLHRALMRRLPDVTPRGPVHAFARALRAAPPNEPVRWSARHLAVSPRHLRRVLVSEVGLTPKRYARLIRFLRTVRAADRLDRPPWARLAADGGYSDQAHMIHEFCDLARTTPAALHHARRAQEPGAAAP